MTLLLSGTLRDVYLKLSPYLTTCVIYGQRGRQLSFRPFFFQDDVSHQSQTKNRHQVDLLYLILSTSFQRGDDLKLVESAFLFVPDIFMENVNVSHKELMLRQMIDLICRILFYLHSFPLPESLLNLCSFLRAFRGKRLHNSFELLYFVLSTFISMRRSRKPC